MPTKTIYKTLISTTLLLFLSGCTEAKQRIQEYLESQMMAESKLQENEDYLRYRNYEENNLLAEDGLPLEVQQKTGFHNEDIEETTGSVHVTFAYNPFISVYYSSEENSKTQLGSECYLKPGDTIYCKTPQAANENSSTYHFLEFRIYEYDSENNRGKQPVVSDGKNHVVYKIPIDFKGKELSIEPIGKFENRILNLHDYYIDSSGKNNEMTGLWIVNEKDVQGTVAEADSTDELRVEYQFDSSNYYVSKAEPTPLSNSEGIIKYRIYQNLPIQYFIFG